MYEPSRFANGGYLNIDPTPVSTGSMQDTLMRYLKRGKTDKYPPLPIPVNYIGADYFKTSPSEELAVIWLGHSSFLLELEGKRYLLDPVLSKRVSFTQLAGPARLHPSPLKVEDIGQIDAVILSHDHYDHMDYQTLIGLKHKADHFITPLSVGDILIDWGVDPKKVVQMDWWQELYLGKHTIAATPARHFTGRGALSAVTRKNPTLWASWCILGENKKVFFTGDTGRLDTLSEIGQRYGEFDLTFLPIGAYDDDWALIHTNPEEALEVHKQVNGKVAIPCHWGTFDLAIHPWSEPIHRFVQQAALLGVTIHTPQVGQRLDPFHGQSDAWWQPQASMKVEKIK